MNNFYTTSFLRSGLVILSLFVGINLIEQVYINTNERFLASFSNNPNVTKFAHVIEKNSEASVVDTAIFVFQKVIGFYLVVITFFIGTKLSEVKIKFQQLCSITLVAYAAFLLAYSIKVVWFAFQDDYILKEFAFFYPLSLMDFFNYNEVEAWSVLVLQITNLFQILFIFLFAIGLRRVAAITFRSALIWTTTVYLTSLMFWVALVTLFEIT